MTYETDCTLPAINAINLFELTRPFQELPERCSGHAVTFKYYTPLPAYTRKQLKSDGKNPLKQAQSKVAFSTFS